MAASRQQSDINGVRGGGITFGPYSNANQEGTAENTVGSTSASGHGDHPKDNADDSAVTMPGCRYGPPQEDLDGEKMATLSEGKVMDAQLHKKHAGWGEEASLTSDLDRKKTEQRREREEIEDARRRGVNIDGGAGGRLGTEDNSAV